MNLTGMHLLLTYKCDMECDHCFVWGSPNSKGVFTLEKIRDILAEAESLDTVKTISIEGGEPFLYYPIMIKAIKEARKLGFSVEVLSNCFWGSCPEDAVEWLLPLASEKVELSLSSDLYHGESWKIREVENAVEAARRLDLKASVLSIKNPKVSTPCPKDIEGAKVGLYDLMYKGRAASKLAAEADKKHWREFTKCPYENLSEPERVHVDPLGYVHVCQGISIGNAWNSPFSSIIKDYTPQKNPILEPLTDGGPAALAEKFVPPQDQNYADPCHLCYETRCMLREKGKHLDTLAPDQMYGQF